MIMLSYMKTVNIVNKYVEKVKETAVHYLTNIGKIVKFNPLTYNILIQRFIT